MIESMQEADFPGGDAFCKSLVFINNLLWFLIAYFNGAVFYI